ncbi:MarR family winged helix-turn-helix transcriptional regulator [Paradesertivirga mongoliensis]|uniref:MarR family winged helix-turn-helix transcriptional regulator n=1 Tax=Paradesertivirga mongoliensis TaxID=2100740 RepID=A0ABW4ZIQ9_9SPHI|nr:MarR family transcriptional regulator [Pedobacter mongoliensis]
MAMKQPLAQLLISVTKKYLSIFSQQTGGLDIDRYQYVLVLINLHKEQLTQKALSELLEVDKSFMVNIVDYLSSKGYVVREKNINDRRQQVIKLTDKAREAIPKIEKVISRLNKQSMENLSEEKIQIFSEVLLQISHNLAEVEPKNITINYKNR